MPVAVGEGAGRAAAGGEGAADDGAGAVMDCVRRRAHERAGAAAVVETRERPEPAADIDNPQVVALLQQRQEGMDDTEVADNVGQQHLGHVAGGVVARVVTHRAGDAGVVDQHVQVPPARSTDLAA